jgi:hypothetical protein
MTGSDPGARAARPPERDRRTLITGGHDHRRATIAGAGR